MDNDSEIYVGFTKEELYILKEALYQIIKSDKVSYTKKRRVKDIFYYIDGEMIANFKS